MINYGGISQFLLAALQQKLTSEFKIIFILFVSFSFTVT